MGICIRHHRIGMGGRERRAVVGADANWGAPWNGRVLHCFFVLSHSQRKVLHFNATERPTSGWIMHQLREAFPERAAPRYLTLDRDRKYQGEATEVLESMSREPIRTSYQSPR